MLTLLLLAALAQTPALDATKSMNTGPRDVVPSASPERERGALSRMAQANPASLTAPTVLSGALRSTDALGTLLLRAGWNNLQEELPEDAVVSPRKAASLLTALLQQPLSLGRFPPRMAACHLLREVLASGPVSREELSHRVGRFKDLVVLRPDGYLAWTLTGQTQQKVGPMTWTDESFRAGPFEMGRFYSAQGGVFRKTDMSLAPVTREPPLAEVYDDADYLNRTLDGAEESFVALYHAVGQLLTRPMDSLAALRHLPVGVAALIASSPEYLERFRVMTRGEQIKAISKLTTDLIVTFGAVGGSSAVISKASAGAEAALPVLSLSAEGAVSVERVAVPVGQMATVLSNGPGLLFIVHQMNAGGDGSKAHEDRHPVRTDWKPGTNDLDWRGTGKSHSEALDEAFKRTGNPREDFVVTRWGKDAYGKSFPVEWRSPSGAEVNIDMGHVKNGPSVPHVGFQTPGKRGSGGAVRGHILLDNVPFNR